MQKIFLPSCMLISEICHCILALEKHHTTPKVFWGTKYPGNNKTQQKSFKASQISSSKKEKKEEWLPLMSKEKDIRERA